MGGGSLFELEGEGLVDSQEEQRLQAEVERLEATIKAQQAKWEAAQAAKDSEEAAAERAREAEEQAQEEAERVKKEEEQEASERKSRRPKRIIVIYENERQLLDKKAGFSRSTSMSATVLRLVRR